MIGKLKEESSLEVRNKYQYESRAYFHGELTCPNPREYYRMTRSYGDMKREWEMSNLDRGEDLNTLNCNEPVRFPHYAIFMLQMLGIIAIVLLGAMR